MNLFRALRYKNYRLFFGGQSVSLIGTWMQKIAMSWLVYRLTNSVFLLGIVGFTGQIPTFLFAPIAGVLADRWNKRRILIITQILAMAQALCLALLVMTNTVQVWQIVSLSIVLGIINAFDIPARQSFVVEMIECRDDLGNAIALNSSMVNGARLLGPSIAGVLIAAVGEGLCFLINGLSYIGVIWALMAMEICPIEKPAVRKNILHDLKEGVIYAFGFAPIRSVILLLGLVSLMGMPYHMLMPVFAKDVFHGGPHTLGFLMGAAGGGALAGAVYLASRKTVLGLGRKIPFAAGLFGLGLIAFSHCEIYPLSLALMFVTGFGMMVEMAGSNTALQTMVDDDKRGRVMAFYTMAFMGMAPFGSLIAGVLAGTIGAPNTLMFGGAFCVIGALLFLRKLPALKEQVLKNTVTK
ncbi:MAG: MFS transporter [Planctomycetes bacterium]|nr:MFS transporter [Planctomycetota bacterium]